MNEKTKQVLEDLVSKFADGTDKLPEAIAKSYIMAPAVPCSKWTINNRVLTLLNGTTDARGYRQWQQVNRHVKKGAKAIYILVPKMITVKDDNADSQKDCEKNNNSKNDKDCKDDKERKKAKQCIGFSTCPVFRYEDTEGDPLEEYVPKELPPLFGLAKYNGIDVLYANTISGEYGSINVDDKHITLSTESPDTYLHELVHYYDLRERKNIKHGQDATQETVAQLAACVLARMYSDYDASRYTWDYIAGYADATEPAKVAKQCLKVMERVGSIIDAIISDAHKIGAVGNISDAHKISHVTA